MELTDRETQILNLLHKLKKTAYTLNLCRSRTLEGTSPVKILGLRNFKTNQSQIMINNLESVIMSQLETQFITLAKAAQPTRTFESASATNKRSFFSNWLRLSLVATTALSFNLALFQAPSFAAPRTIVFYGPSSPHDRFECKRAVVRSLRAASIGNINSNNTDNTLVSAYVPSVGDTLVFTFCVPLPNAGLCPGTEGTTPVFLIAGVTNDADRVSNRIRSTYRPPNSVLIDGCNPNGSGR